jgi:serine protease inhibitor
MRSAFRTRALPLMAGGIATTLLGLCGCGSGGSSPAGSSLPRAVADAKRNATPVDANLVASNNSFGFSLFRQLTQTDPGKNVFLSPTSIALALEIVYNGAGGDTQQAMAQTLQLQGVSITDLNNANAALQASLDSPDPQVQLIVANSLWLHQDRNQVKQTFIQTNQDFYGSEIGDLAGVPDNVNAWVSGKTNGKITDLLPKDDYSNTVAIIVNAIYFKGAWAQKFDAANTADGPFTLADGTQKSCRLMHQTHTFGYFQGDHFQALRLPYGQNRLSMMVFLPDAGTSLSAFLANLTPQNWNTWMGSFHDASVDLALPRFKSVYGAPLNAPLTALGMGIAFDPNGRANFEGIAQNAYITKVQHKTFVEVTEEGTEAAAATSVGVGVTSVMVPVSFTVDHPFFCAIRDDKTGVILFLGSILDPTTS